MSGSPTWFQPATRRLSGIEPEAAGEQRAVGVGGDALAAGHGVDRRTPGRRPAAGGVVGVRGGRTGRGECGGGEQERGGAGARGSAGQGDSRRVRWGVPPLRGRPRAAWTLAPWVPPAPQGVGQHGLNGRGLAVVRGGARSGEAGRPGCWAGHAVPSPRGPSGAPEPPPRVLRAAVERRTSSAAQSRPHGATVRGAAATRPNRTTVHLGGRSDVTAGSPGRRPEAATPNGSSHVRTQAPPPALDDARGGIRRRARPALTARVRGPRPAAPTGFDSPRRMGPCTSVRSTADPAGAPSPDPIRAGEIP